jgi:hypothetical protein
MQLLRRKSLTPRPFKTKAIASARIKTDKIDSTILAHLLRTDLLPAAYIPPRAVRDTREVLRYRAALLDPGRTLRACDQWSPAIPQPLLPGLKKARGEHRAGGRGASDAPNDLCDADEARSLSPDEKGGRRPAPWGHGHRLLADRPRRLECAAGSDDYSVPESAHT